MPVKLSSAPPSVRVIFGPTLYKHLTSNGVKIGFGDAVILIYIAAFIRQYLWVVGSNAFAWIITIALSGVLWFVHLRTKDDSSDRTPLQFWLLVALPLFLVYAMRAAFPDTGFDILDYRLINAERALRGFPFIAGDFFPTRFPFNPAPDMVTGITRHLFGYRLGTIINYFVLLWTGTILNRLLVPYVKHVWVRCLGVLLILLTEHALFVINNYMVDLLALPLLLEAARLSVKINEDRQTQTAIRIALFLGASVAFKLTNLAFALPILLVYIYNILRAQPRPNMVKTALSLVSFVAPLLPFTIYIYRQTGNPVFPLYNRIFRSPFWPVADLVGVRWSPVVDDPRWLDMRWWEQLLWPILLPFQLEHTAGGLGPHAGRLSVCFIAAILGLLLWKKDKFLRYLSFITLFGAILWSSISGMLRYATYLELAGGVIVICFAARLYHAGNDSPKLRLFQRGAFVLLLSTLVAQSAIACVYSYRFEWGSRPSFFENPKAYLRDSKYFLRDYSLASFLPARERALIEPVQAWAESNALESGIEVSLKSDAAALCLYMPEFFDNDVSFRRFFDALGARGGGRVFSLTFSDHLEGSLFNLRRRGFGIGRVTQVVIPYYSEHTRIHMSLIEAWPLDDTPISKQIKATQSGAALADNAYRAELNWSQTPPAVLRSGLRETVFVKVKNVSDVRWPVLGQADGKYRLSVGNHWLDGKDKIVINDDGRSPLPYDLGPQQEIDVPLTITTPQIPGDYVLEVDVVQEGVTWFGSKGSSTLKATIKVEK
ncbi:MAG TPA: hypothetical protein VFH31_10110 [Pyrinomonadaceae bacterium]|nr:hypothetical protein [Pyrinomonadaceae bacterium]